jgi:hypothetical protein
MNELHETRWTISASFGPEDDEISVAHMAKICDRLEADPLEDVEYEVELTGTFGPDDQWNGGGPTRALPGWSRGTDRPQLG